MTDSGGAEEFSEDFDIPDPELDQGWQYDIASQKEEEYWGDLDKISQQKKNNELNIHKTIGFILPAALIVSFLMFLGVLGVYVLHLVIPVECRWLAPAELATIHNMLFSGVVGGAVAIVGRMYLLKD